jgi:hypothetical protein
MTTNKTTPFAATQREGRFGIWIDGWVALTIAGLVVATKIIDAIITAFPS